MSKSASFKKETIKEDLINVFGFLNMCLIYEFDEVKFTFYDLSHFTAFTVESKTLVFCLPNGKIESQTG